MAVIALFALQPHFQRIWEISPKASPKSVVVPRNIMSDIVFFCTLYIFGLCIVITICIYLDFDTLTHWFTNQDMENMQSNCNNQDLDQETLENLLVIPPPYLHFVDFTHLGQDSSNSDLPPSYDNCSVEHQPPSYFSINV